MPEPTTAEKLEQFEALLLRWNVEFTEAEREELLDFYNQMRLFFSPAHS